MAIRQRISKWFAKSAKDQPRSSIWPSTSKIDNWRSKKWTSKNSSAGSCFSMRWEQTKKARSEATRQKYRDKYIYKKRLEAKLRVRNLLFYVFYFYCSTEKHKMRKNDFRSKKKSFQFDPSFFLKGAWLFSSQLKCFRASTMVDPVWEHQSPISLLVTSLHSFNLWSESMNSLRDSSVNPELSSFARILFRSARLLNFNL